jgi:hypothetical protein
MSARPPEFRCLDFTACREGNTILIAAQVDERQIVHLRCDELVALLFAERLEKANAAPRTPAIPLPISNLNPLIQNS